MDGISQSTLQQLESLLDSSNDEQPVWTDKVTSILTDVLYVLENNKIENESYNDDNHHEFMDIQLQDFISTYTNNDKSTRTKIATAILKISNGKNVKDFLKDISERISKYKQPEKETPDTDPNLETPNTPTK